MFLGQFLFSPGKLCPCCGHQVTNNQILGTEKDHGVDKRWHLSCQFKMGNIKDRVPQVEEVISMRHTDLSGFFNSFKNRLLTGSGIP